MRADCPSCGKILRNPSGVVTLRDDLLGLHLECPNCEEFFTVWFKGKILGRTMDDCIATIPHRFFYPAPDETEQSMLDAGVQKPASEMKGN